MLGKRGQGGERQHLPPPDGDLLPAEARQAKGDLGPRPAAQHRIGARVPRRGMAQHGEAFLRRGEDLDLLMRRPPAAPPPLPVNERPVRRVHQSDDGMINVAGERHRLDDTRNSPRAGKSWRWPIRLGGYFVRRPDEQHPLAFADDPPPRANAADVEGLTARERGNGETGAVRREAPAVIGAFHRLAPVGLARESPRRKRRGPMGAGVAQSEGLTRARSPQGQRRAHELAADQPARTHGACRGEKIPKARQPAAPERHARLVVPARLDAQAAGTVANRRRAQ